MRIVDWEKRIEQEKIQNCPIIKQNLQKLSGRDLVWRTALSHSNENEPRARNYRELVVWQKAMELARQVYKITMSFPPQETYGLTSQIRRCAVSIPSNIAEGQARYKTNDFMRFLHIALGSLAELDTQIILSNDFGYMTEDQKNGLEEKITELRRMIYGLLRGLTS